MDLYSGVQYITLDRVLKVIEAKGSRKREKDQVSVYNA